MNPRQPTQTFLDEADELLTRIEEIALEFDPAQESGEAINQLFRAFHTIKGSGAMFGFDAVAAFTHHVETVMDQVRNGALSLSEELINLLLRAKDHLKALLDATPAGRERPTADGETIVTALKALLPATTTAATEIPCAPAEPAAAMAAEATANDGPLPTYRIRFRPDPGLLASGTNPLALLNELRALGECRVAANLEAIPTLAALHPDCCYLAWEITLATGQGPDAIKDVFIFVEDGSELTIALAAAEAPSVAVELENQAGSPTEPPAAPPPGHADPSSAEPAGVSCRSSTPPLQALCRNNGAAVPSGTRAGAAAKASTVRVPSERLDRLVRLVGELVMNQSRLTQVAARASVPNLAAPVEELERLVAELRDNVLGIRMMPIGTTFSRFKRLVHDLSQELGKEIDLVTEGAETELDKTVLDQLGDPLVHLIRNSLDHGIELPAERLRRGKPRCGTIALSATHVGSNVVITIRDDGRGIDAAAVRAKAVAQRLIAPDAR